MQVLVTGARTATLLQRLPFLPAADAYVCENGGRIFYPDMTLPTACQIAEDARWRARHTPTGALLVLHQCARLVVVQNAPVDVIFWGAGPCNGCMRVFWEQRSDTGAVVAAAPPQACAAGAEMSSCEQKPQ